MRWDRTRTETTQKQIIALYAAGEKMAYICAKLNVSEPTIRKYVKQAGIYRGKPNPQTRNRISDDTVRQIIGMYMLGYPWSEIKRACGVNTDAINRYRKKAGLQRLHWEANLWADHMAQLVPMAFVGRWQRCKQLNLPTE